MRSIAACLLLALLAVGADAHNGEMAVAVPVEGIVCDGDLSDWPDGLPRHPIDTVKWLDEPDSLNLSATMRLGIDRSKGHLYVAVDVTDQSVVVIRNKEGTTTGWQEADGILLSLGGSHDDVASVLFECQLRGEDLIYEDPTGVGDLPRYVQLAGTHQDKGHRYEFAIDIDGLGIDLSDDIVLPLQLHVRDRDAEGLPLPRRGRLAYPSRWLSWGPGVSSDRPRNRGDLLIPRPPHNLESTLRTAEAGFQAGLRTTIDFERRRDLELFLLVGFAAAASALHFFLFVFHHAVRSNLYYAAFVVMIAVWYYTGSLRDLYPGASYRFFLVTTACLIAFLILRFLYSCSIFVCQSGSGPCPPRQESPYWQWPSIVSVILICSVAFRGRSLL